MNCLENIFSLQMIIMQEYNTVTILITFNHSDRLSKIYL